MEAVRKLYRCKNCGNLSRFDVTVHRVIEYFHHQRVIDSAGEVAAEDAKISTEEVIKVTCRWCQGDGDVEEREEAEAEASEGQDAT